jgi:serine/threonine-protein kinase
MADVDLQESPLQLGVKFLKYDVAGVIGRGGFAWVYRGHDSFMGRDVAIKILHRKGGVTDDMLRRGQAEAKLLSRLRHSNIVEIYDAGVSEQNLLYIIMELLVGRSLSSALHELGQLTLGEGLPLFLEIADAFETAHRMGAIHRDIKPENIFVTEGNHGKVLDFGIAKITDGGNPLTTNQGMMIGTMKYMSPEQVQGQRVTPSSDIYCLGLVMYEAFSGIHPCFVNTDDASYRALAYKQVVEIPPSLDSVAKGIPRELSRLVDRCISKRVSERYQSMAELVKALQACLAKVQRDGAPLTDAPRDLAGLTRQANMTPPFSPVNTDRRVLVRPNDVEVPREVVEDVAPVPAAPVPTHTLPGQGEPHLATLEMPPRPQSPASPRAAIEKKVVSPSPQLGTPVIAPPVARSVSSRPVPRTKPRLRARANKSWWTAILVGGITGSALFASGTHWYYNYVVSKQRHATVVSGESVAAGSAIVGVVSVTPLQEVTFVAAPPASVHSAAKTVTLPPTAVSSNSPSTTTPKPKKAKPNSMDAKLKAFQAEQAADKQWDPTVPLFPPQ